ncbi:MAG TPA: hypothetical protein VFR01_04245, partial [Geobacterales bacterium]|nr:hypothetical protein [Geobacterales bacterium]
LSAGPFAGQPALYNRASRDLTQSSELTLRTIQLGGRGTLLPQRINYALVFLAGDNAVTHLESGNRIRLLDGSVTVTLPVDLHLRLGLFKYPGSEEGGQPQPPGNYINFSSLTRQLLLEHYFRNDGSNPRDANFPSSASLFRDSGAMLFGAHPFGNWEGSWGVMVGNGSGVELDYGQGRRELYLSMALERIFSGEQEKRHGLKFFSWFQDGERQLQVGPLLREESIYRQRWGGGVTLRSQRWRAIFEGGKGKGVILTGSDGGAIPGSLDNAGLTVSSFNLHPHDIAWGWYGDLGYRLLPPWWLDFRYDTYHQATDTDLAERRFDTITLGSHLFVTRTTRLMVNYEFRHYRAPKLPDNALQNILLKGVDNRLAFQLSQSF